MIRLLLRSALLARLHQSFGAAAPQQIGTRCSEFLDLQPMKVVRLLSRDSQSPSRDSVTKWYGLESDCVVHRCKIEQTEHAVR